MPVPVFIYIYISRPFLFFLLFFFPFWHRRSSFISRHSYQNFIATPLLSASAAICVCLANTSRYFSDNLTNCWPERRDISTEIDRGSPHRAVRTQRWINLSIDVYSPT
ncbi:hypothetical protein F5X98DRAFT_324252 [Xylaria grammica]|nr:hypothetical protein F5X98DRAFT_324252 [Xylaria grammica]